MGQYFNPVFLNDGGDVVCALSPADYGCGDGLFGHTRAHTRLHYAVQALLSLESALRLVWAGDNAEDEADGSPALYWRIEDRHFKRIAGLLDPACTQRPNMESPDPHRRNVYGVTWNLDKHAFIDNMTLSIDNSGWHRTPLPELAAEAGPGAERVNLGSWARDRLIYRAERPGPGWTDVSTT